MAQTNDIGIDLGTSNVVIYMKGNGIVFREPSVVAMDQRFNPARVVAVGSKAKEMIENEVSEFKAEAEKAATEETKKKTVRKTAAKKPAIKKTSAKSKK